MNIINDVYTAKNITATGTVKAGGGVIGSVLCAASSSGTITIYDGTSTAGTKLCNAVPLTAGAYFPFPASVRVGIHAVIGGTADITFFYN